MAHQHTWEPSMNSTCPACDGAMELCTNRSCRMYRCKKSQSLYTQKMDASETYVTFTVVSDEHTYYFGGKPYKHNQ